MPTHTQTMVEPKDEGSTRDKGSRDDATLRAAFSSSPIYNETYTDENRKEDFMNRCMRNPINDGGHTFGTFDPNFTGAPNFDDVETGGGGLPANAWSPNTMTPIGGSTSPEDMPSPPEGYNAEPSDTPFIGEGAKKSPHTTSASQSLTELGEYTWDYTAVS